MRTAGRSWLMTGAKSNASVPEILVWAWDADRRPAGFQKPHASARNLVSCHYVADRSATIARQTDHKTPRPGQTEKKRQRQGKPPWRTLPAGCAGDRLTPPSRWRNVLINSVAFGQKLKQRRCAWLCPLRWPITSAFGQGSSGRGGNRVSCLSTAACLPLH